jgi:3-oxoacid CoA-transferase subunit A
MKTNKKEEQPMSILFSGDFHNGSRGELNIITKESLLHKYGQEIYERIKYHIILGDGGFMWPHNEERDKFNYTMFDERPFPVLCVLGNHDPIYGMKNVSETDIGLGETVYKLNDKPFIAYLKRGKVYHIEGIKFLVLGGALSIDQYRRTPGESWWKEEYWDEQEKKDLFTLLESDNVFDCVISHTGPCRMNKKLFPMGDSNRPTPFHPKFKDEVGFLNDEIHKLIQFQEWFCGHWHEDEYYYDGKRKCRYRYLYWHTKILEKTDGKLTVHNEYGNKGNQR